MKTRWMFTVCVVGLALAGAGRTALAQTDPDVEELRKEVRALRNEVSALRVAISEAAELDRQRAAALTRALDRTATTPQPTSPPAPAPTVPPPAAPAPPTAPPVSAAGGSPSPVRSRPRAVPSPAAVGTVSGKVEIPSGEPVAYVYVENIREAAVASKTVTIEQSGKQFSPRWAVIQRGTTVSFPNLDSIYHNVFSRSPGSAFDLGLYNSSEKAKGYTFLNSGPVDVYCNIHPKMSASLLIVPNRHFAKVAADGTFTIPNVPAGKRKIVAWAPGSAESSEWVEFEGGDGATLSLKLASKSTSHTNKDGRPYGSYP